MPSERPEGSLFPYPQISDTPLLDFQCTTKSSIYVEGDEQYDQPMILVDTNITYDVGQACEWCLFAYYHWKTTHWLSAKIMVIGQVLWGSMFGLIMRTTSLAEMFPWTLWATFYHSKWPTWNPVQQNTTSLVKLKSTVRHSILAQACHIFHQILMVVTQSRSIEVRKPCLSEMRRMGRIRPGKS